LLYYEEHIHICRMNFNQFKFLTLLFLLTQTVNAQVTTKLAVALESNLSFPLAKFSNANAVAVPRYTNDISNLNVQQYFILSKNIGFSIKSGYSNVGLIHRINDSIKLKQRAYVLPLGVQINMGDALKKHIFIGAEYVYAFNYKQKTWLNGQSKQKYNEWFSDKVNQFTPAFFVGYQFSNVSYVQVRYQAGSLINENYIFNFKGVSTRVNSSNLITISLGTFIIGKEPKAMNPNKNPDLQDDNIRI